MGALGPIPSSVSSRSRSFAPPLASLPSHPLTPAHQPSCHPARLVLPAGMSLYLILRTPVLLLIPAIT